MKDYIGLLPALILTLGSLAALLCGTFNSLRRYVESLGLLASLATLGSGLYLAWRLPVPQTIFFSTLWVGGMYSLLAATIGLISGLGILFLGRYLATHERHENWEAIPIALLATAALTLLPGSNHLLLTVVIVETVSLALYVLVGFSWRNEWAAEAALKYFLMGTLGFAFLVFGLSYLYGLSGTLYLHHLRALKWEAWYHQAPFIMALGLMGVGLLFKLAVFPFHWWVPDAYGGGTPGAVGIAVALGKTTAAFLGFQLMYAISLPENWRLGLAGLAALSVVYGNLSALQQTTLQRLLGYSSIAHGSYVLLGLLSGPEGQLQAIAYALVYGLMSVCAFGLLSLRSKPLAVEDLRGLGQRHPGYSLALAITLASLSGLPPFVGFFAKYAVFAAAFRAGHLWPAVIALLGALIGYYYYWRPIGWLYQKGEGLTPSRPALASSVLLLLFLGLLPMLWWGWLDYLYGLAGYFHPRP
ncbi:MAG: NADH-quinone oxidoreductase subunit N [Bacteroidia bacterium]